MLFCSTVFLFLPIVHASERLTEQDRFRQCGSTYRIDNATSSVYTLGGDVVFFAARTVDEGADRIQWEVDPSHSQINLAEVQESSITKTDRLILKNVTKRFDLSKYRYTLPNGFVSAWVTLRVGSVPRISTNATPDVFVLAGELISVICVSVTGLPAPNLFVQLKTEEGSKSIPFMIIDGECVKMNSTAAASGIITSTATNCFGNSSLDFRLSVLVKPSIHLNIKDGMISIDEYRDITVSYQVNGVPSPHVVWHQDGITLTNSTKSRYNTSHLIIQDLTVQDAGVYSIVVTNELGSDQANFTLKVNSLTENKGSSGNFPWWCSIIIAVIGVVTGSAITVVVYRIRRYPSGGYATGNSLSDCQTNHEDVRYVPVGLKKVDVKSEEEEYIQIRPYATTHVSEVKAACSLQDYEEPICDLPGIQERSSNIDDAVSQEYEVMSLAHTYVSPIIEQDNATAEPLNFGIKSTDKSE